MGLVPRDWSGVRDAIVSRILGFTTTSTNAKPYRDKKGDLVIPMGHDGAWLIICMMLSSLIFAGIFRILGLNLAEAQTEFSKYGVEWIILALVLFFLPRIVLRGFLRYREVPRGWTKEQTRAWEDLKTKTTKSNIEKILDTLEIFFDGIRDARMGFEHVKQETERTYNMKWKDFKLKTWIKHFLLLVGGYCAIVVIILLLARIFVKDGNMEIPIFVGMLVSIYIFARIYARKNRFKRKYVE